MATTNVYNTQAKEVEKLNLDQHARSALVEFRGYLNERRTAHLFQNRFSHLRHFGTAFPCSLVNSTLMVGTGHSIAHASLLCQPPK